MVHGVFAFSSPGPGIDRPPAVSKCYSIAEEFTTSVGQKATTNTRRSKRFALFSKHHLLWRQVAATCELHLVRLSHLQDY